MPRRLLPAVLLVAALAGCGSSGGGEPGTRATPTATATATATPTATPAKGSAAGDWTRFGFDAARTGVAPDGPDATAVRALRATTVALPGTADSSPVLLHGVQVGGAAHDLLVLTTTYGITVGLDASDGHELWRFTPTTYDRLKGSPQITQSSPVADPSRDAVYTASPDGRIHKLRVADGSEVRSGGWPVSITRDPTHEKIPSALNLDGPFVLATTGGYIGDAPPYQGKVVAINRSTGRLVHVWNSLCSNRRRIIAPSSCGASDSAIWGRGGAVVAPHTHRVYVATGNAPFNGSTNWGDSVLELSRGAARLRRHFTPAAQDQLNRTDADVGSASPALLPGGGAAPSYLLQGGKDDTLRLLSLRRSLHGVHGAAGRRLGGEVQTLRQPGGQNLVSAPLVLRRRGRTEVVVATPGGTDAYALRGGRLHRLWSKAAGGTSPVVAGGLLYVYDPAGALNVYRPASGARVQRFDVPAGHWNSPIVAGGRVYLPTGSGNDHATKGRLVILG